MEIFIPIVKTRNPIFEIRCVKIKVLKVQRKKLKLNREFLNIKLKLNREFKH